MSIPFIISLPLFPIIGAYVDKYGQRLYFLLTAGVIKIL